MPLAILVKAPTRGADSLSGLTATECHDPQNLDVEPQEDFEHWAHVGLSAQAQSRPLQK